MTTADGTTTDAADASDMRGAATTADVSTTTTATAADVTSTATATTPPPPPPPLRTSWTSRSMVR